MLAVPALAQRVDRGEGGTWIGFFLAPRIIVNPANHNPKNQRVKLYSPPLDNPALRTYTRPMDTSPIRHTKWSDRLAFDVALTLEGSGETLQEIISRHSISANDILVFNADPVFLKRVDHYRGEIRERGMTFRLKARSQAEELLTTSWLLIHDPAVSPAVKADLIKSTVKWAGLEPKDSVQGEGAGGGVKITINLGNTNDRPQVINADYEETDDESGFALANVG